MAPYKPISWRRAKHRDSDASSASQMSQTSQASQTSHITSAVPQDQPETAIEPTEPLELDAASTALSGLSNYSDAASSVFSRSQHTTSTRPSTTGSASAPGKPKIDTHLHLVEEENELTSKAGDIGQPLVVLQSSDLDDESDSSVAERSSLHSFSARRLRGAGSALWSPRSAASAGTRGFPVLNAASVGSANSETLGLQPHVPPMPPGGAAPPPATSADAPPSPEIPLAALARRLDAVVSAVHNNSLDLSKASLQVSDAVKAALATPGLAHVTPGAVTTETSAALPRVLKVVLHFADNLLCDPGFAQPRSLILRAQYELCRRLGLVAPSHGTIPGPRMFAVGSAAHRAVRSVVELAAAVDSAQIADQDGAFLAPVLRGLSPVAAVTTVVFGFPNPEAEHYQIVRSLYGLFPDVHFCCQRDSIRVCGKSGKGSGIRSGSGSGGAGAVGMAGDQSGAANAGGSARLSSAATIPPTAAPPSTASAAFSRLSRIRPPFRIPPPGRAPPMSVSVAVTTSSSLSGTLGGYVYPKVSPDDTELAEYAQSAFALTCGHVVLPEAAASYPHVAVPSPVLVNLYAKALRAERNRYAVGSEEYIGYQALLDALDAEAAPRTAEPFGQVVWGERAVVRGAMSDVAVIKCRDSSGCRNHLGDDVPFAEYDPALLFGNLYVKKVVSPRGGLPVFKYGSTSKYTAGRINGPKLVYWAGGKLHSSEFVVVSGEVNSMFANGGDSGAWILTKLADVEAQTEAAERKPEPKVDPKVEPKAELKAEAGGSEKPNTETEADSEGKSAAQLGAEFDKLSVSEKPPRFAAEGLGVVGMLHSYDGELKQFGLFTPMEAILDRLQEVTKIPWGLVGVRDGKADDFYEDVSGSESDAGV